MATSTVNVTDTAYSLLTITDSLIQNTSSYSIRVVFDSTLPAVDVVDFHVLAPGQAISILNGLPAGSAYARCEDKGRTASVAVSS